MQGSVATSIKLKNELDKPFTRLDVRTRDRPGLLVDIVRTLKDCNCNVLSAEVDTIGNEVRSCLAVLHPHTGAVVGHAYSVLHGSA